MWVLDFHRHRATQNAFRHVSFRRRPRWTRLNSSCAFLSARGFVLRYLFLWDTSTCVSFSMRKRGHYLERPWVRGYQLTVFSSFRTGTTLSTGHSSFLRIRSSACLAQQQIVAGINARPMLKCLTAAHCLRTRCCAYRSVFVFAPFPRQFTYT